MANATQPREMTMAEGSKVWLIQAYDGLTLVASRFLPGFIAEKRIEVLLQCLAARDLTMNEVMGSFEKRGRAGFLEVRREARERIILSTGENPHYIASLHTPAEIEDIKRR